VVRLQSSSGKKTGILQNSFTRLPTNNVVNLSENKDGVMSSSTPVFYLPYPSGDVPALVEKRSISCEKIVLD
jgi:hypothetical protein